MLSLLGVILYSFLNNFIKCMITYYLGPVKITYCDKAFLIKDYHHHQNQTCCNLIFADLL